MNVHARWIAGASLAVVAAAAVTAGSAAGQSPATVAANGVAASTSTGVPPLTYKVPKTPWGEPDLQGTYNGNDLQGIPMQRAESVGTRYFLNTGAFLRLRRFINPCSPALISQPDVYQLTR